MKNISGRFLINIEVTQTSYTYRLSPNFASNIKRIFHILIIDFRLATVHLLLLLLQESERTMRLFFWIQYIYDQNIIRYIYDRIYVFVCDISMIQQYTWFIPRLSCVISVKREAGYQDFSSYSSIHGHILRSTNR